MPQIQQFIKNFTDWFQLKPKLDDRNHKPPLVSQRDIFWCHLGENIGTEISGKSNLYTRPVIIVKKLSRHTFLVIPTSTKIKEGSWFVFFKHKEIEMVACLHQIKIIDYRRLQTLIGKLDSRDFQNIKTGLKELYDF
jgi:mRNA interferase MazF